MGTKVNIWFKSGFLMVTLVSTLVICQAQDVSGKSSKYGLDFSENPFILLDSAKAKFATDVTSAFELLQQALSESIKQKNQKAEAACYQTLGNFNKQLEQHDIAIDYYLKSLKTTSLSEVETMLELYMSLGESYRLYGDPENSNAQYQKALDLAKIANNVDAEINIRYELARNYTSLGKSPDAVKEYEEILTLEKEQGDAAGLAEINSQLGEFMLGEQKSAAAEVYYKESVEQAQRTQDKRLQSNSLRKMSKVYRASNDYEQELETQKQSLALNEEAELADEQFEDNLSIGDIYLQQNKADQAVPYIEKSLSISEQTGNIEQKGRAYKKLSEAFKDKKEYNKALTAYTQYAQLADSVFSQRQKKLETDLKLVASINRNLQRIEMLERDYMISKKTVELLKREQTIRNNELLIQKRITYVLFFVILFIVISGAFVLRSSSQKRKANMLLALKSLRSQMNPHFIFNSLNAVNNFISQNNEKEANKFISDFSRLMRTVLENSKHDFVPLQSEIDMLSLYLKLEHQRFADKFDYSFEVGEMPADNTFMVPPMLIQPYIENAVWHGLRYKETKGKLSVKVNYNNKKILVVIADDGIGRKQSAELKTKHQKLGASTGLKNTEERLNILNSFYKTSYAVSIRDLDSAKQTGTIVEIAIPVMDHDVPKNLKYA